MDYAGSANVLGALITLGALAVIFFLLPLIYYLLYVIGTWKIFTKAGVAGWKSIIPLYNVYNVYKICWKTSFFWIWFIATLVMAFATSVTSSNAAAIISYIALIVTIVLNVMQNYKLAKAFGYGIGMTLGLLFLPEIFLLILGFGSATYQKPQE